jgi:hypothetical protein
MTTSHEAFQRYQLETGRAKMVRKYRASPGIWPDGIDSKHDRWYSAKMHKWTDDYIASLIDNRPRDEVASAITWAAEPDPAL